METKEKTSLTIRVNKKTKLEAREVLDKLGLDMSSAIALFLNQVATDQGLPFRPTVKSELDEATELAEQDVLAGRVTEYASFEDFKKKMESL